MTFGEKVREARGKLGLKQSELAEKLGVTTRVISTYETDKSRPRGIEQYKKLAIALEVNVNYLLSEEEEFIATAHNEYGARGAKQARELVEQMGAMFAGGELSEEDMDGVMRAMQELYWDAKKINKKYTPKKHSHKE